MKKTSDYTREQIKQHIEAGAETIERFRNDFVVSHIPRFHQLIMLTFPKIRTWLNYTLLSDPKDKTMLTLVKNNKIIAQNFTMLER